MQESEQGFETRIQTFDDPINLKNEEISPALAAKLLSWAQSLPDSPHPLLDIAAGQGVEAAFLSANGYPTIAQDPSELYKDNAYHDVFRMGVADHLPDENESIRGIICKDVWLFLSPRQRMKALTEAYRVLVLGGSMLIISEATAQHRAHYIPKGSKYPQRFSNPEMTDADFYKHVESMSKNGDDVFTIDYKSTPDSVVNSAVECGFGVESVTSFSLKSELAQQNKYAKKAGFVVVVKKL